ncbi:hypothetical protein BDDG_12493 [Blastomyces dermatitidis ATCC 18188]|uniref:Uncharacterized protein n=1 Tax=Ajellomyces dermatitidis (strain ATCC 18188 / CBS 674.68) TaxID=653446 RepID=A0A0J9ES37_AJEDA|nr:hypothetical protein BDDG_12493 [Blastomyces dermatitidis ATCC 18188]
MNEQSFWSDTGITACRAKQHVRQSQSILSSRYPDVSSQSSEDKSQHSKEVEPLRGFLRPLIIAEIVEVNVREHVTTNV